MVKTNYLKRHNIGHLDVQSGLIDITDPGYDNDIWCALHNVKVKPGNYIACSYYDDDLGGWGRRVGILQIVHEDAYYKIDVGDNGNWKEIGSCAVDAGLMSICESPKPNFTDKEWFHYCDLVNGPIKSLGTIKTIKKVPIVSCTSGIGDGCYPVFAIEQDDDIVAVEVRFTNHPWLG